VNKIKIPDEILHPQFYILIKSQLNVADLLDD